MDCLIIDDEPFALGILEEYISNIPNLRLIRKCSSVFEAYQVIREQQIDLIILDIQMPVVSGVNFINSLNSKPMFIFTTAHSGYAVEAFNMNSVDYLLKPFSFERFLASVTKADEIFYLRNRKTVIGKDSVISIPYTNSNGFILVKSEYQTVRINIHEILYIEGLKDYVKIHLSNNPKPVVTHNSLKKMAECLPKDNFIRVHKSFIISIQNIQSINKTQVIYGEKRIPIGEGFRDAFLSHLNTGSLNF